MQGRMMIQNLIQAIATLLQNNLVGVNIKTTPIDAPPADQLPAIALYATTLLGNQRFRDRPVDKSPMPLQTTQLVTLTQKRGPYPLDHTPLSGTMTAQTVPNPGDAPQLLTEGADFSIDTQPIPTTLTVTFSNTLKRNSQIALAYSFQGLALTQDIEQELLIDVYAVDPAAAEQWASLSTAIILASHNSLLTTYNSSTKTQYQAKDFSTVHTIDQIQLIDGIVNTASTISKLQLKFGITGQLQLIKEIHEGAEVIREIPLSSKIG
jgi:hypothetical protein